MAVRKRIEAGHGYLPEPPAIVARDGKITAQEAVALNAALRTIVQLLNGNVSLGDGATGSGSGNVFGQYVDVLTPSGANTEFQVDHGLDRLPVAAVPIAVDKAANVYDSSRGSWGASKLYLKCDTASVTLKLWIF